MRFVAPLLLLPWVTIAAVAVAATPAQMSLYERTTSEASNREEQVLAECRSLEAVVAELRQQLEAMTESSQAERWDFEDRLKQQVRGRARG